MHLFSGNRGEIYLTTFNGKKAVIKKLKPGKPNTLKKEARFLCYLDKFAPKLYKEEDKYIIMEYIEGISLKEALNIDKKRALRMALEAAFYLDNKGVWHKELGRYYHFIFGYNLEWIRVIDFERAVFSKSPRNVLQVLGFYVEDRELAKAYSQKKIDFKGLLGALNV